jgi:TRAP-type C4-dicarboxylate transport system permease small subunit
MVDVGKLTSGVVLVLVGVFVTFTLFNTLFGSTNLAATTLNGTMTTAGYSNEGNLVVQIWKIFLLAIPIGILGIGVKFIIDQLNF